MLSPGAMGDPAKLCGSWGEDSPRVAGRIAYSPGAYPATAGFPVSASLVPPGPGTHSNACRSPPPVKSTVDCLVSVTDGDTRVTVRSGTPVTGAGPDPGS